MFLLRRSLEILFLCDSFNSVSQRLYVDCIDSGHKVTVHICTDDEEAMIEEYESKKYDLVICPYLTKAIPSHIYDNEKIPCWIVHLGLEGDRGLSSIDWALYENQKEWGITIIQATKEIGTGDIWISKKLNIEKSIRNCYISKAEFYRTKVNDYASIAIKEAILMFLNNEEPHALDYSKPNVKGCFKPEIKQSDRIIDWNNYSVNEICRILKSADTQPGYLLNLHDNISYFVYGSVVEEDLNRYEFDQDLLQSYETLTILGKRNRAILIKCGNDNMNKGLWISHLKKQDTSSNKYFKLPSTEVLPHDMVENLPNLSAPPLIIPINTFPNTFQEVFEWKQNDCAYIWFDFYNGAISTKQCRYLNYVLKLINQDIQIKKIILLGGTQFFCNNMNLNTIENSNNSITESWDNMMAMNDLIKTILDSDKLTISAIYGNSGIGGTVMAIAADLVWSHDNAVIHTSFKSMNIYGSGYWTYSFPRRVGNNMAKKLMDSETPISAKKACQLGLIDKILTPNRTDFIEYVLEKTDIFPQRKLESLLKNKKYRNKPAFQVELNIHRTEELSKMKESLRSQAYHDSRQSLVYKTHMKLDTKRPQPSGTHVR